MRAAFEVVVPHESSSLVCRRTTGECFGSIWHYHPELELILVERSHGMRFVGDNLEPFDAGDLVLIGPNVPHIWVNQDLPRRRRHDQAIAIVVQFREDFLGRRLWHAPEFAPVAALLRRSRRGVHFHGAEAAAAAEHIRRMAKLAGAQRLAELLVLLDLLAGAGEQRLLSTAGYIPKLNRGDARRVAAVCRYVRRHLVEGISEPAAAAAARLSPARFSAFFRQRFGRTFTAYVNDLRVSRAIRLMIEEKMNASEACFASGFKSLANFNYRFRTIKGMSPREYLRDFRTDEGEATKWALRDAWIFPEAAGSGGPSRRGGSG
ncbi:MAG: AraC family transcriptional regulator [Opitutaceae bacterium]